MIRRSGPCGRPRTRFGYLTDWATGDKTWLAACTRHDDWWQAKRAANEADRPAHPPLPAANHGGVLARHFPELDWPKLWTWASGGTWQQHPEEKPRPKPSLILYLGVGERDDTGADAGADPAVAPGRATLVAVPSGDRE
jgi:hypothetical protein